MLGAQQKYLHFLIRQVTKTSAPVVEMNLLIAETKILCDVSLHLRECLFTGSNLPIVSDTETPILFHLEHYEAKGAFFAS